MNLSEEEKQQTWIIGVSGGSDSMALLHMCITEHISVIAAHMNYQKRASASRDMEGVRTFCEQHRVPVIIKLQEEACVGNFQAFARAKRYEFYHELIEQYHAYGVLVAHQKDDVLETYLLQQQRSTIPVTYGLQDHIVIYDCFVVRPLLHLTKHELEAYCTKHHVPYWLDESNQSDEYARNRIRHNQIEHMTNQEKDVLIEEIHKQNERHHRLQNEANQFLSHWDSTCSSLLAQREECQRYCIHTWIWRSCHYSCSTKEISMMLSLCKQANNWTRTIHFAYDIRKEYGTLSILTNTETSYSYTMESLSYLKTPYFQIIDHGEVIEGVTLHDDDFPIEIRPAKQGDYIQLRFGRKKINRWFIDRKIPLKERKIWPVMVNAHGNIIFVPKIGCDIAHFSNNPNAFVIK